MRAVRPRASEPGKGADEGDDTHDASVDPQLSAPYGCGVGNVSVLRFGASHGRVGYGINRTFELCEFHVALSSGKHSARGMPSDLEIPKWLMERIFASAFQSCCGLQECPDPRSADTQRTPAADAR